MFRSNMVLDTSNVRVVLASFAVRKHSLPRVVFSQVEVPSLTVMVQ